MLNKSNKHPINNRELGSKKNLDDYMVYVSTIERISVEEERELVKLKEAGDLQATQQLVVSLLPFVVYIAKNYLGYKLPFSDIIQEGNIGLMHAIKKFDSKFEVRVATYATLWIKSHIHEYVIKNSKIVKMATTKPQRKLFFKLRSNKTHDGIFTEKEVNNLSDKLNVKVSDIREMEKRFHDVELPFDSLLGTNNVGDQREDTVATIPSQYLKNSTLTPEAQLVKDDSEQTTQNMMQYSLATLTPREQDIIKRRWLDEDKPTLHTLAAEYNISAERVRQVEKAAMAKMRKHMTVLH